MCRLSLVAVSRGYSLVEPIIQSEVRQLLFVPSLWVLEQILEILMICPYGIIYHLLYRQNLPLILMKFRVTPIKILRNLSKSLLRIHQYGITKEVFQRKKSTIEECKAQDVIISCTSPCITSILAVRKPNDWWWRFVHDSKQHCYPWTSFVSNHHTLLTSIPTGSKLFTVIDLLSTLFGTIVDEASQYPFAFP